MKILFVCTGNIFRSMSGEYCAKKYVQDHGLDVEVASAGVEALPQSPHQMTVQTLFEKGIDCSDHKQRKLTKKMFQQYDIVVAMGEDHKAFIKEQFGVDVPLFNELAYGKEEGVLDIWESVQNWTNNKEAVDQHISMTVTHICEGIPALMKKLQKVGE